MLVNHFCGFRKQLQEQEKLSPPPFTARAVPDYLGRDLYWSGQKFPVTKTHILNVNGNKITLVAGTNIGLQSQYANKLKEAPSDFQVVPVEIGNPANPKIPTESDTAHGKPSKYAGNVVELKYGVFKYLIQPGDPSAAAAAGMGGMGAMGGGLGGMAGPGAAPAPGGMGAMPPAAGAPPM